MESSHTTSAYALKLLLKNYREGDAKAFDEFFNRTQKYVYNFIRIKIFNKADQEDLFQTVYLNVHRYILSYDDSYNPITWLSSISKNVILKHVQKKRVSTEEYVDGSTDAGFFKQAEESQFLKNLLAECFTHLNSDEIELISRRFLDEEEYEEIGKAQKTSAVAVRKRISRILDRLRMAKKIRTLEDLGKSNQHSQKQEIKDAG